MQIDTKSIKPMLELLKFNKNAPSMLGLIIAEWEDKHFICALDGRLLLMQEIPSNHGLELYKVIPMNKELLKLNGKTLIMEPIDAKKLRINGQEVYYEIPACRINALFFKYKEQAKNYKMFIPELIFIANKFCPGFYTDKPYCRREEGTHLWIEMDKRIMMAPIIFKS